MSAAVQASPLNRLAANLEELGLEGMASSVPEYVRLVADGRKSLVDAMLELTDAQIALKRRADDERRDADGNDNPDGYFWHGKYAPPTVFCPYSC